MAKHVPLMIEQYTAYTHTALYRTKFCNINETFEQVIVILVNWHILTGILMRIARYILVKIPVELCQFTKVPMTRLNLSLVLQNVSQHSGI